MEKAERLTLYLDFPEGQKSLSESVKIAEVSAELRQAIYRVLGRLDLREKELQFSSDTIAKVSAAFANTPFCLERSGDRFSIREREAQEPAVAVVAEDREEPDYCAHFKNGK